MQWFAISDKVAEPNPACTRLPSQSKTRNQKFPKMNPTDWIFSLEAKQQLDRIAGWNKQGDTQLQIIKRLRESLAPAQVSQLMELQDLRIRGKKKFSRAEKMFFSRTQLEQATSEAIASYKARRLQNCQRVADLCCGIGGDAIGLAAQAELDLVDSDRVALEMARHNLQLYQLDANAICGTAESYDVTGVDAVHLDPDRRTPSDEMRQTRTVAIDYFSPSRPGIQELMAANPNFAIKLAPATKFWEGDFEFEFIGHQRECKQQVVWSGNLTTELGSRATVLDNNGQRSESYFVATARESSPTPHPAANAKSGDFLYDPHSALLASGLLLEFAEENHLELLDQESRYLRSHQKLESMLVSGFQVEDVLKPDTKIIQKYLSERKIGFLDIKKRGQQGGIYSRLKKLKLKGDQTMTIMLSGTPEGFRAIACNRIDPETS